MKAEKMTEAVASQTLGEKRVRTTFNPSNNSLVDQIKQKTAELINLVQEIPLHDFDRDCERDRLTDLAEDRYEEAAMWAVKAATLSFK